jgi:hypothetical protein
MELFQEWMDALSAGVDLFAGGLASLTGEG